MILRIFCGITIVGIIWFASLGVESILIFLNCLKFGGNSMKAQNLSNKPLIEAIFEVRWGLEQDASGVRMDPNYKLNVGRIYEELKHDYPKYEQLPTAGVPDDLVPYIVQHRFRKGENSWPLVQVGPGILTLNDTENYSWNDFKRRIEKVLTVLDKVNYTEYESISLIYINAVDFNFAEKNVFNFLKEHFGIELRLPGQLFEDGKVTAQPTGLEFRVDYPTKEPSGIITLRIERGIAYNKESLIWMLSINANGNDVPHNKEEILNWVGKAHDLVENWFFMLLSDELRRRSFLMHEIIQSSATISSRGQVQIPAKIRKAIGAQTGDLVIFRMLDDGTILMKVVKRKRLSELYGSLKSNVKFSSLEEETENTKKIWAAKKESERLKG